ncbi:ATP-binding protein [Kitasatospora sp. NRRL B-11411]|uniref:ATP-binding protein n=1 Tax=Kitasatospora sp. NRRL B-11411 TaxID=1463822 RepID=UPI0012FEE43A|nr:ATP-binding protein [Kitasatospora sp. NRRL B-11411]
MCILEGFGGVGKTRIANAVIHQASGPAIRVVATPDGLGWDDLLIGIGTELEEIGDSTLSGREDGDLFAGLLALFREECLIVLDDIDVLLEPATGLPPKALRELVVKLSQRTPGPGRLLLVTNRSLPAGDWRKDAILHTVYPPNEAEGINILDHLLSTRGLRDEIPIDRRRDVVKWLGCNPRALEVLVSCLADEPLENLIELGSDAWEARDQVASPDLVRQLEEQLATRSLRHLDISSKLLLQMLAVYRSPFKQDAIDRLDKVVDEPKLAQAALSKRFFVSRERNWFSLNPVVREIAKREIMGEPRRLKVAHSHAAEHFTRHFRADREEASFLKHGASFVEARFHLLRIGRESEFEEIAASYRAQILASHKDIKSIPDDPDIAQQTISILTSALAGSEIGYPRLRYLLARLLLKRNRRDDDVLAFRQVTYATRTTCESGAWLLRVQLSAKLEGFRAAESTARQALIGLHSSYWWVLYRKLAIIALHSGKPQDALRILAESLEKVELKFCLPLYSLTAYTLTIHNRSAEAIELLTEGYRKLVLLDGQYSWRLFEQAIFIAHARRDSAAISKMQELVSRMSAKPSYSALCRVLSLQAAGEFERAAQVAESELYLQGDEKYHTLAAQCAFSWLCCGNPERARVAISGVSLPQNSANWWLRALVGICCDREEIYVEAIQECTGHILTASDISNDKTWLTFWDDIPEDLEPHPAFYFPRLPASLTGLDRDLVRLVEKSSALETVDMWRVRLPTLGGKLGDELLSLPPDIKGGGAQSVLLYMQNSAASIKFGGDEYMRDKYEFEQAAAVGPKAKAENVIIQKNQSGGSAVDLEKLSDDLTRLRQAMRSAATDAEHDVAVAEVAQAMAAANGGDEKKALQHLAKAGKWAWDMANSIGASLAAAILKSQLGL